MQPAPSRETEGELIKFPCGKFLSDGDALPAGNFAFLFELEAIRRTGSLEVFFFYGFVSMSGEDLEGSVQGSAKTVRSFTSATGGE